VLTDSMNLTFGCAALRSVVTGSRLHGLGLIARTHAQPQRFIGINFVG